MPFGKLVLVAFFPPTAFKVFVQVMYGFDRQDSAAVGSGPVGAGRRWHMCLGQVPQLLHPILMAFFLTSGANVRQKRCFAGRLGDILAHIATVTAPDPCAHGREVGSEGRRNPVQSIFTSLHVVSTPLYSQKKHACQVDRGVGVNGVPPGP